MEYSWSTAKIVLLGSSYCFVSIAIGALPFTGI